MIVGLGIDTGGTYTDAVLVDMGTGKVVSHSKDLTTREDLVVGITGAVRGLDPKYMARVSFVSLSTTLATNSLVEGKGCRVGAVCMGRDYEGDASADMVFRTGGAHDLQGRESESFDEEGVRAAAEAMRGVVDAVAVTGYLSVRNPEHEERAGRIIHEMLGVPVVLGHSLSSGLGYNERACTAITNARLIPVISGLIADVKESMKALGIDAPLMIVKGDGTIMNAETAEERPVETVLSGPASSLTGAVALTGLKDALMVDVGGTTTDIGILRGGRPRLEKEGAMIDGMRTRVLAAAISTYGIGGDSRIVVNGTRPFLTPVRVIPLCIAAKRWPRVTEVIRKVHDSEVRKTEETVPVPDMFQPTELFVAARPPGTEHLQKFDAEMLRMVDGDPRSLTEVADALGINRRSLSVSKMEKHGLLTRIGVTPTDILAAEGTYTEYGTETSRLAVEYLARKAGMPTDDFIDAMKGMVEEKISECIVREVVLEDLGRDHLEGLGSDLVRMAISGRIADDFGVTIKLREPIIGIGAPVGAWLPGVAKRLGTTLVIPELSEVGNAIGAVAGSVSETRDVLIRPKAGDTRPDPSCSVFADDGVHEFETYGEAVEFAKEQAVRMAREAAVAAGALEPVVECRVERRGYRNASENSGEMLLEAHVVAIATGKPDVLGDQIAEKRPFGTSMVTTKP